jgi:hypothetical protein
MFPGMRERAASTGYGQVGEFAGSVLPYFALPESAVSRIPSLVGRILTRSTLPSVLQPTGQNDPNFWGTKLTQAGLGTLFGEALQGVGGAAKRWLANRAKEKAAADAAEQAAKRAALQRTMQQTAQMAQHRAATAQHATDVAADQAQRAKDLATHQAQVHDVITHNEAVDTQNQRIREHVDRTNAANQRIHQADQAAAAAQKFRQAGIPTQATREMYDHIYGLIGEKPPAALDWRSPTKALNDVGKHLNGIYQQMSVEGGANSPLLQEFLQLRNTVLGDQLQNIPSELRNEFREDFKNIVMQPLLHTDGDITGDALVRYTSSIRSKINEYGLAAQQGKFGSGYRNMAQSMDEMLEAVEHEMDARTPGLAEARQHANQAYHLADVEVRAAKPVDNGIVTPAARVQAWQTKVGRRSFGRADSPYAPLRQRQIDLHGEHTAPIEEPIKPPEVKGVTLPRREVPSVPDVVTPKRTAPKAPKPLPAWRPTPAPTAGTTPTTAADYAARVAAHALRAKTGIPVHMSGPVLQGAARRATRAAPYVAPLRHGGAPAAAATGYGVSGATATIPEIVVTAPRYRPGQEDQQQ